MRRLMISALLLGACAQTAPVSPTNAPQTVTTAQAAPGAPVASGEARIPVTVASRNGASSANCIAEGTGFRSVFQAPTTLAVPTFGPGTGGVRISCEAGGLRGAVRAEPSVQRFNAGGLPAVGIGVGSGGDFSVGVGFGGGWAGGGQSFAVRFPPVEVMLSPAP